MENGIAQQAENNQFIDFLLEHLDVPRDMVILCYYICINLYLYYYYFVILGSMVAKILKKTDHER